MSNVNQAYFDRVRFILQNDNLGSLIIEEPIGWDNDEKELTRHKDYHGIFPKFSNNLKFQGQAYDYLKTIYDVYGINAEVRLVKDEKHPKTDQWTRSYFGYLDMSTRQIEENKISFKFNSGGLEMEIKARESESVEITRNTTLDGLPLSDLPINEVELDGRRIFLKTLWEADEVNNSIFMGVRSSDGNTRGLTAGYPFKLITKSHDEAHSVIPATEGSENNGSTGMMMLAIFDRERTIRLTGTETSFLPIIIESDWQWAQYKISLVIYENGINYNVRERRTLFFADTNPNGEGVTTSLYNFQRPLFPSGSINTGNTFSFDFDETINVQSGDSVAIEIFIKSDLRNTAGSERYYVTTTEMKGKIVAEEDSFFEKSISKCVLPHEAAERLIEIYTNKKVLKSDALGRTDIGYQTDGKASLVGLSHGFWIRGFDSLPVGTEENPNPFRPLTTSLKEFLESYSATHNLGLGIENDGFKEFVRIEELGYFYNRNTTIKLPYQVKKVKRSDAVDYFYSSIEMGYEKGGDYEEAFGLAEYNGTTKFSTVIKRLTNKYTKLSKYRADSYGAEFARRKPNLTHGTEDTRYDSDVFQFDMKRDTLSNVFKLRKWQDDFEIAPSGTFSPETAYNLRLSPFNCMLRHGWTIASGLTKYLSDYVRYASSTANSSLSTKLIGGNEYAENGNIINSEIGRPRYVPEFIEFEHEVTFEINQLLMGSKVVLGKKIPNIYGCIEFTNENGEQEKGFLMNLKPNKQGQWKLLKVN
ncbi:MAG: hypothetical protein RSE15_04760 [Flavobacterium sp.]|uniref:hypothetical protein n=1 Tax=Flavobacterium sp. TaxID=239 RepID=UPI002B47FB10|nr:hypothetical protein [Flavobacterium sp.]WRH74140.1 MAG: hypothetical protein RSE15_04760 [Flavobacterium sp.]